jgi:predicted HicB family RNase H-like nuclease
MDTEKNVSLNFKVPKELYDKLNQAAKANSISLAAMVRVICSEYFNSKDK